MAHPVFRKKKRLNSKFLTILLPPVVVSVLILMSVFGFLTYRDMRMNLFKNVSHLIRIQKGTLAFHLWNYDADGLKNTLDALILYPGISGAAVYNAQKRMVSKAGVDGGAAEQRQYRYITQELIFKTSYGTKILGNVRVSYDYDYIYARLSDQLLRDTVLLLMLVTVIVISAVTANRLTIGIPLQRFLAAVRRTDEKNVRELVDWSAQDEMGQTIAAYNALLLKLTANEQALIQNQKKLKKIFSKLEISHGRFAAVMNSVESIIYVADMDTYELLFINEYTRNIFGDVEGLICWQSLQAGQEGPCPFCTNRYLLKDGIPAGIYSWDFRNSITGKWCHIQDQAIRWIDERLVRFEIATDISNRKQAEKDLEKAKEAAEAANKAKSAFLSNMSHELRTPLNAVLGYADILQREASENQKKGLNIIKQSGNHLLDLINDVLDLAKIESGTIECSGTDFHFYHFLIEITEMIHLRAERKGLYFKFEADENELPSGVHTDQQRLRQVLLNLLSNAVNYTETGGITFKVEQVDELIHFTVLDTGIGISSKYIDKIFDPFYQADALNDHGHNKGTGLGLAISRTLIELLGGKLDVKSKPGHGAAFHFALHISETSPGIEPTGAQKRKIIGIRDESPLVLIADDKPENRSVLTDMLMPLGFKTIDAENGLDGFDKAVESQPDAIITDLVMPKSDGLELIRRVRDSSLLKDTIIIVVSASAYKGDRDKCLEAGADAFLPKPIDYEKLLSYLKNFLNLEWVYRVPPDDDRTAALSAEIIPPSPEILKELLDVAETGDVMRLRENLTELGNSEQAMVGFVSRLRQMSDEFRFDSICKLLKKYMQ
ncbi:ATP-binding protein [Desulfococcaceae bacterium HSG9]|nr:ATP-binding protein [Desulfococcaceae bacterium HSG9]